MVQGEQNDTSYTAGQARGHASCARSDADRPSLFLFHFRCGHWTRYLPRGVQEATLDKEGFQSLVASYTIFLAVCVRAPLPQCNAPAIILNMVCYREWRLRKLTMKPYYETLRRFVNPDK